MGIKRLTHKEFIEKVNELSSGYTFLDEYVNTHKKLRVVHEDCGKQYEVSPNKFISQGRRCPNCKGGKAFSKESFDKAFEDVSKGEYILLKPYINTHALMELKHQECGNIVNISWSNFKQGYGCKFCSRKGGSKAVREIKEWFEENEIEFEIEKKFDGCKRHRHLPFDFFLPDYNLLIEYDGEQHFRAWSGSESRLKKTKERDTIKTSFVEESEYELLRISYKEDHIAILSKEIGERSTTIERH